MANPGNVFWVDENASSPGRGTFKNPDTSIDSCMSRCVANRGDIIMVKPGHIENISAAGDLTCDVAGVTILGTGCGSKQAKIVWDTADTADVDVTAANVTFSNLWLYNNYANVDGAFDVSADGDYFTIQNCRWTDASAAKELEEGVNLAAGASYFAFINNEVKLYTGSGTESLVFTAGECVDMTVVGNSIVMAATAAIFDCDATALTGTPLFKDNLMINLDTTTGLCVAIDGSTVGVFVGERYGSNKNNTVPASALTVSYCIDCHGVDQDNTSSIAWPGTATAWT
ncbi:MAG: hypothetical protein JRI72_00525 [Deltaproteobacteria bacterium]|nr:hypothetical protein [Deltaproteobacteria bacterium]